MLQINIYEIKKLLLSEIIETKKRLLSQNAKEFFNTIASILTELNDNDLNNNLRNQIRNTTDDSSVMNIKAQLKIILDDIGKNDLAEQLDKFINKTSDVKKIKLDKMPIDVFVSNLSRSIEKLPEIQKKDLKTKIFHLQRFGLESKKQDKGYSFEDVAELLRDLFPDMSVEVTQFLKNQNDYKKLFNVLETRVQNPITQIAHATLQKENGDVLIKAAYNKEINEDDENIKNIKHFITNENIIDHFRGKEVKVHLNLALKSRGNFWSVKSDVKINNKIEQYVIGNVTGLSLKECRFEVHQSDAKRTNISGQRNVHAFVVGKIDKIAPWEELPEISPEYKQIVYNPLPEAQMREFCYEDKSIHKSLSDGVTTQSGILTSQHKLGDNNEILFHGSCGKPRSDRYLNMVADYADEVICTVNHTVFAKGINPVLPKDEELKSAENSNGILVVYGTKTSEKNRKIPYRVDEQLHIEPTSKEKDDNNLKESKILKKKKLKY
jgi:hypothetical protein